MNNKGQMGMILVVFITVIVGVVLFQVVAQEVGSSTTLSSLVNQSLGTVTNGTTVYLAGFKSVTDVAVVGLNGSGQQFLLGAGNYTVTNNAINPTTQELTVSIEPTADGRFSGNEWNITATAQSTTYISDGGSRSVAGLIAVFFALAVAVVAISPTIRSGLADFMKR